jgi:hypothetical protein
MSMSIPESFHNFTLPINKIFNCNLSNYSLINQVENKKVIAFGENEE